MRNPAIILTEVLKLVFAYHNFVVNLLTATHVKCNFVPSILPLFDELIIIIK